MAVSGSDEIITERGYYLDWAYRWMGAWLILMCWIILKGALDLTKHVTVGWRVGVCVGVVGVVWTPFVVTWRTLGKWVKLTADEDKHSAERRANAQMRERLDEILAREKIEEQESALRADLMKMREELT